MAQEIQQQDIFGRIGRSFGEGAAGQVERNVTANALSKIPGIPKEYGDLARTPRGAELLPSLSPLILQGQKRKAFLDSQEGGQNPENGPSPVSSQEEKIPMSTSKQNATPQPTSENRILASPERVSASNAKILQPPTTQERDALAARLINSGQILDVAEARQIAQQQLEQDRAAQSEQLTNLQNGISKRIGLDLQGGGLADYKDVAGEIQRKLLDEARVRYLDGAIPEQVEQDISSIITDLGKVATKTKALGSLSNLAMSSKNKVSQLRQQKKDFEEYGFGEQFDDLAQAALGITAMQTAAELNPLKNKEFKSQADSFKSKLIGTYFGEKQLNRLIESITPEDNILSMAAYLRDKNLDVGKFLDRTRQKEDLTPQQKRQLQKPASNSMLGDILFKVF